MSTGRLLCCLISSPSLPRPVAADLLAADAGLCATSEEPPSRILVILLVIQQTRRSLSSRVLLSLHVLSPPRIGSFLFPSPGLSDCLLWLYASKVFLHSQIRSFKKYRNIFIDILQDLFPSFYRKKSGGKKGGAPQGSILALFIIHIHMKYLARLAMMLQIICYKSDICFCL